MNKTNTASLMRRAIETMKLAREYEAKGDDIYSPLFHETKKVVQWGAIERIDSGIPAVRDFYETMLIVGRAAGDPWTIIDCQKILKGQEYARKLESRFMQRQNNSKQHGTNLFSDVGDNRQKNKDRKARASLAVKAFLDKYENNMFE